MLLLVLEQYRRK